jgi:hypothetical protein
MKKILLLVLLVVIVAVASIPLWIDSAAKSAIQTAGSDAMGVATTLKGIDIGIFGGEASLEGLEIANPEGFKDGHFLKLGGGTVAVDLGSLMGDEVVIPTLTLTGVSLNLERSLKGSNYGAILKNMEKGAEETAEPGKKFIIKELIIRDVEVSARVSLGPAKPAVPLALDEMRFENVGSDGSGVSMRKLFRYVITGILNGVAKKGKGILPDDITKGLTEGLGAVAGLLGEGGKSIIEDVGGGAKKITDGLGGLLGRDKKDEK